MKSNYGFKISVKPSRRRQGTPQTRKPKASLRVKGRTLRMASY